jgi:hypothetical protein
MNLLNINEVTQYAIKKKESEQFAINFAIWLYKLKLEVIDRNSVQQLLEIYKKETDGKH